MDLMFYIVASGVYIMFIHFAVAIKNQFNVFLMIGVFALGGLIGGLMGSYEIGFVVALILSLVFW